MNVNVKEKIEKLEELLNKNIIDEKEYNSRKETILNEFINSSETLEKKQYFIEFSQKKQFYLWHPTIEVVIGLKKYYLIYGMELKVSLREGINEIHIKSFFRKTYFKINLQTNSRVVFNWNRWTGRLDHEIFYENYKANTQNSQPNQVNIRSEEGLQPIIFLWYVFAPGWAIIFLLIYLSKGQSKKASQAFLAIIVELFLIILAVQLG